MNESVVMPKSIKVLHLIDSGGLYGAEKMLLALVEEQVKQGLQPMILSVGDIGVEEKPLELEAKRLGLPIKVWRMKPGLNFKETLKILCWTKAEGFNQLHSHGYKFNLLMGLLPKIIRKLPLITTVHGYVKAKKYSKMWLYEWLDQRALAFMDKVCVVSEPMLEMDFAKSINQNKLVCIANGIAADYSPQRLKQDIVTFKRRFPVCLCAIGRLSPEKGFTYLVEAIDQLFQETPELKQRLGLVIIGEGGLRKTLQEQIDRQQLSSNIYLAGYQANAGDALAEFDGLVMPSLTEGLPITLLEAMRASCPIVATRVGGIPSVLDSVSAQLIETANLDQLKAGINMLLSTPDECRTMASNARSIFINKYASIAMTEEYSKVYGNVFY